MTQRQNSNKREQGDQRLFFFAIVFLSFALLSFFAFLQHYNIISGAGTSGTVNFTILPSERPPGELGSRIIKDKSRILSFDLEVIPKKITIHAAQYDYTLVRLRLIHHGTSPFDLAFSTNVPALKILEEHVSLKPGEEKEVILRVDTIKQGIFLGVLTITDVFVFKQLPVLIQVDHVDFRVGVDIPEAVETILPGQDLYADVIIEPLYGQNVTLAYRVQDTFEHVFLEEQESLPFSGPISSFRKTFAFSEPLPLGDYFLLISAKQLGKQAMGGDSFGVDDSLEPKREFPVRLYTQSPWLFFLIVLAILLLHILMAWHRKE